MARALRLAAALLCLALAGCGGGGEGGGSDRVQLQVAGGPEELAIYREVVAAYERETGERVQLVETPDSDANLAKLTTAFAAGSPPDLFLINYRNFGPFAARGALQPVGPRLDRSEVLSREDYYAAPLDSFTWEGELQCLPQNASSLVTYVNLDFLRAAGVRPPRGRWSFDEFVRVARRLREEARRREPAGSAHALGVDPGLIRLAPFIWSAGGELVDDLDAPSRFVFGTPAARRGIDRFLSLYREGLVPREVDVESQPLEDRFIEGTLAMFMSSRREVPSFRTIEGFDWDVAPFPGAERPVSVLHSDGFCMADGADADTAFAFLEFIGGPEGQRLLARGGRTVPSLKSVARSPDFLAPDAPPRSARVFLDALEGLRRLPNSANWPRVEDSASLAFKRAFYDELSVAEAIERIEDETRGAF